MDYKLLNSQLDALSQGVTYEITLLANASALIYNRLDLLNWCGFYLVRKNRLTLGPFQGKPACTVILPGKGVCGTALTTDKTVTVPDVHLFPGHIACDSASNSEIVIPIHRSGAVYGVLDLDSPVLNRFSTEDAAGLTLLVQTIEKHIDRINQAE